MTNDAIERAVSIAGSQQKLADLCGVSQPTVWRWLNGGGIDTRFITAIVKATQGQVTSLELRPDLADLANLLKAS